MRIEKIGLHLESPFPFAQHRLRLAILAEPVDVQLIGANHEVHMHDAFVAAGCRELLGAHAFTVLKREAIGAADGNVAGGILVEQGVVEQQPGLGDG